MKKLLIVAWAIPALIPVVLCASGRENKSPLRRSMQVDNFVHMAYQGASSTYIMPGEQLGGHLLNSTDLQTVPQLPAWAAGFFQKSANTRTLHTPAPVPELPARKILGMSTRSLTHESGYLGEQKWDEPRRHVDSEHFTGYTSHMPEANLPRSGVFIMDQVHDQYDDGSLAQDLERAKENK